MLSPARVVGNREDRAAEEAAAEVAAEVAAARDEPRSDSSGMKLLLDADGSADELLVLRGAALCAGMCMSVARHFSRDFSAFIDAVGRLAFVADWPFAYTC